MAKHGTEIGWTHVPGYIGETWNPQVGCSKKSAACDSCYAIDVAAHPRLTRLPRYQGLTVLQQGGRHNWARDAEGKPIIRAVPDVLDKPLRTKRPTAYFVGSMTDLFHENADRNWTAAIFGVMAACPQHIFMLLTKRPDVAHGWFKWVDKREKDGLSVFPDDTPAWRIRQLFNSCLSRNGGSVGKAPIHDGPWPLPNVWIGTTCEDQQRAEERIPWLIEIPAVVRYISYEPALGPVDFTRLTMVKPEPPHGPGAYLNALTGHVEGPDDMLDTKVNWIIAGGESGTRARPSHPEWFRSVRDQCTAAEVPFFMKQWGEWLPVAAPHVKTPDDCRMLIWPDGTTKPATWAEAMETCGPVWAVERVGKKRAGRHLDGVEWSQFPEARP
jgi:protein gp37